jgi:hypothetical protein
MYRKIFKPESIYKKVLLTNLENEIVKGALITHNGEVVHQRIKELLK